MSFPKVEYPLTTIDLGGKKYRFRPLLVRDEKILLTARQSEDPNDIFTAIRQVVNNAAVDELDVDDLPIYLLEWAFLNLRISSIGDTLDLSYRDTEDQKEYKFQVKLGDIKLTEPAPKGSNVIDVSDDLTIVMRYPPSSLYANPDFLKAADAGVYFEELLLSSIKTIYHGEQAFETKDSSRQELEEFVESLDSNAYRKMQDFLASVPHMEHTIKYKNSKGTEREITLRTLNDFFML